MFVKICGVTTEQDGLVAVALGADALGFNFVPGSVRQLKPMAARDIVNRLPTETLSVGIFRDMDRQKVVDITHDVGLGAVQLHGHESPEDSLWIASQVRMVIKAFPAGARGLDMSDDYGASALLIDGTSPGSGEVFDWALAEGMPSNRRIILAGGLHPGNVADGIRSVRPWGVDVSTGVESAPGKKDATKMKRFIENARAAGTEIERRPVEALDGAFPYDWMEE